MRKRTSFREKNYSITKKIDGICIHICVYINVLYIVCTYIIQILYIYIRYVHINIFLTNVKTQ